jgi:sulfur carrier protein
VAVAATRAADGPQVPRSRFSAVNAPGRGATGAHAGTRARHSSTFELIAAVITVNNEQMEHREGMTVQDILDARKFIFRMLAVSVNGQIIARKDYKTTVVPDEADVQVIHMISGG